MREEVPVIPVVEVRETFTPSEALRDELVNLLDIHLDNALRESLRAAFLFKSWRRRVLLRDDYYLNEYDHNSTVYKATKDFQELPHRPIVFSHRVGFDDASYKRIFSRLVFTAISPPEIIEAARRILDTIPTCEPTRASNTPSGELVYVEFSTRNLRAGLSRNFLLERLRPMFREDGTDAKLYVTTDTIKTRETIMRKPAEETAVPVEE